MINSYKPHKDFKFNSSSRTGFGISKGFTLIELILYIAIVGIFISGAILFAWDIIYGRVRSNAQQQVSQNLRLAGKRMIYEIRNASDVNSISASSLSLALTDPARNPT